MYIDTRTAYMYIHCYMLITTVKKKNSDITALVNISALRLCCDLVWPGLWAETCSHISKYKVLCVDCILFFYVLLGNYC